MNLEQDLVESQIQHIESTVLKLLEKQEGGDFGENQQAITENCLHIFSNIKRFDTELNNIIGELNREISGGHENEEDMDRNINLAVNNYYNAISAIEFKLMKIQIEVNKML